MISKVKLSFIFIVLLLVFTLFNACSDNGSNTDQKDSKEGLVIEEIDYTNPEISIIGSEYPKILYANSEKVIFDSRGIYIYDLTNQAIDTSLDLRSFQNTIFGEDEKNKVRSWTFSTVDGSELIIVFTNVDDAELKAVYSYGLSTQSIKEISKKEYEEKKDLMFLCEELEFDDELYNIASSGTVANIDKNNYMYLKLTGDLSSIEIVHILGDLENTYLVFKNE